MSRSKNVFCFDPAVFTDPEFQVEAFLDECNKTSTLTILEKDLVDYSQKLNNQLVELLNRDYEDFISLSSNLEGTEESLESINQILRNAKHTTGEIQIQVHNVAASIETRLNEQHHLQKKASTLESLLEIYRSLPILQSLLFQLSEGSSELAASEEKSQKSALDLFQHNLASNLDESYLQLTASLPFLHTTSSGTSPSSTATTADPKRQLTEKAVVLERLSRLLCRLKLLMEKCKDFDMVQRIQGQFADFESRFQEQLDRFFISALKWSAFVSESKEDEFNQDVSDLLHQFLRAYFFNGLSSQAEKVVAEAIVQPFLQQTLSRDAVESALLSSDRSLLPALVERVLVFLRSHLAPLLHAARHFTNFDFLGNSVWSSVKAAFEPHNRLLLAAGIPDTFHHHYRHMSRLLNSLAKLASSEEMAANFHHQADVQDFRKKWNLSTYFQLRFQEIAAPVEFACCHPPSTLARQANKDDNAESWSIEAFQVLAHALDTTLADSVFLLDMGHRFFKLLLQILARCLNWLQAGVHSLAAAPEEKQNNADNVSSQTSWRSISLSTIFLTLADLDRLLSRLQSRTLPLLLSALFPPASSSSSWLEQQEATTAQVLVREAFQESVSGLSKQADALMSVLCERLVSTFGAAFKEHVPKIITAYRMTGKAPPSEASAYVASCLLMLKTVVTSQKYPLTQLRLQTLVTEVCTGGSEQFYRAINELLQNLSRSESSLRRLTSKRVPVESSSEQMSDADKIRRQIELDIREFISIVRELCTAVQLSENHARTILGELYTLNVRSE